MGRKVGTESGEEGREEKEVVDVGEEEIGEKEGGGSERRERNGCGMEGFLVTARYQPMSISPEPTMQGVSINRIGCDTQSGSGAVRLFGK